MASQELPFLTLSHHRDRNDRPIVLLHSDSLPPTSVSANIIREALQVVPAAEPITLIYLHGGLASANNTSLFSVRTFRRLYEEIVPLAVRSRVQQIIALHVSFSTRAHIYASSFQLQCSEYDKLVYCDLIADLEQMVGVDSTLLGLRNADFDYDEEMRYWVGRQHENRPHTVTPKAPDPQKPLINLRDVSLSTEDSPIPESTQRNIAEP